MIAPTETFIASFSGLVGSLPTELGGATNLGTFQPSSMLVASRFARALSQSILVVTQKIWR